MEYAFRELEQKWKALWEARGTYQVQETTGKPKCYVLDMFPYPSGAGLHVGHPLGYIASDIYARYKRLQGFNVLHPMGYDAFGLPAEQYAVETGQHPAVTTEANIARYREQLDAIGFSFDWSRAVRTSDPQYYKWTQWMFLQLFHSWYDRLAGKAKPLAELVKILEKEGNIHHLCPGDERLRFDADGWRKKSGEDRRSILMHYRLAYLAMTDVWWCPQLETVLANDEVINGRSERGGYPCHRKKLRQWSLRITEYADRLLEGLATLDWSEAVKEMQRHWIGKSLGAVVNFSVQESGGRLIEVFTTRPDTIFGVDFLVLAPEHELVGTITTDDYRSAVAEYMQSATNRSDRERMADVKKVTGCFTGAYVTHPFTRKSLPVYIADYVLSGYGSGAIMGVPAGDDRDHAFAKEFDLPITNIFGAQYTGSEAYTDKNAVLESSSFLSGLAADKAFEAAIRALEDGAVGHAKEACRLRDAGYSRQRYWGEPFPVVYRNGTPYAIDEADIQLPEEMRELPVLLPEIEKYSSGPEGQGPLANLEDWVNTPAGQRETNTMPGYAGSSWYFLRYADPNNKAVFADRELLDYWGAVDVYMGGTEHAVGHLLYARFFTKVLYDLDCIGFDEPFKRLVNQGMIQGVSAYVQVSREQKTVYAARQEAENLRNVSTDSLRVASHLVTGEVLDVEAFKAWRPEFADYRFVTNADGFFTCELVVEKMSKSKHNVVNPDEVVAQYGADTFRMYEMFLGPLEASKPWDTQGIEGVHRFLKKLWRLFWNTEGDGSWRVTEAAPTAGQLRTLHKTIKKVGEDIENFSLNTAVSALMICVNELTTAGGHSRELLEPLVIVLAPFAPFAAAELWEALGHTDPVVDAPWPNWIADYLVETEITYPVAVGGKTRTEMMLPADVTAEAVEAAVRSNEVVQKWLEGRQPKKIIFVPGKMINVVP